MGTKSFLQAGCGCEKDTLCEKYDAAYHALASMLHEHVQLHEAKGLLRALFHIDARRSTAYTAAN